MSHHLRRYQFWIALLLMVLTTSTFRTGINVYAAGIWYVSPLGSDENACNTTLAPCRTLQAALLKSNSGETIKIASGIYTGSVDPVLEINKNIELSGGWDNAFSNQANYSTIDGEDSRGGILIDLDIQVEANHLKVVRGDKDYGGAGIYNMGNLVIADSIVEHNHSELSCDGAGIFNTGILTANNSSINENTCFGNGGGIYNRGELTIENSTISRNQAFVGGGIYNFGKLTVVNATISENKLQGAIINGDGGGIYIDVFSDVSISNSTISANQADRGGGIFFTNNYEAQVNLKNTILAANNSGEGPDCYGQLTSQGYNLFGTNRQCEIAPGSHDLINVNPSLGLLSSNGGSTLTHFLYADSPAIDAGDPQSCSDLDGNPVLKDQRDQPRPLDGDQDGNAVCDIGSFEADPASLPPPIPKPKWFVSPSGNDASDCRTVSTPCSTIQAAVTKASAGDEILVTEGIFTSDQDQVVLVDKDINISGGWDASFVHQKSYSIIDGQRNKRGMLIQPRSQVKISHFRIENGYIQNSNGGGVYISDAASATFEYCFISQNINDSPNTTTGGGGLYAGISAFVTLNHCQLDHNQARQGGGISLFNAGLQMNGCLLNDNTAFEGGGIYASGNQITIVDSSIRANTAKTRGGGILAESVTLVNSKIDHNVAYDNGGGIFGWTVTLENSLVSHNKSGSGGGGINENYILDVTNSTFTKNWSMGGGGAIDGENMELTNTQIYDNLAYGSGGGIYGNNYSINNGTIVRNVSFASAGGIKGYTASLKNTILSSNWSPDGINCKEPVQSAGFNLINSLMGCEYAPADGDLMNVDPKLSFPFGTTDYLTLSPESPAIDHGNPAGCTNSQGEQLLIDQSGRSRTVDGDRDGTEICDIGSFEYDPENPIRGLYLPLLMSRESSQYLETFDEPWSGWPYLDNSDFKAMLDVRGYYYASSVFQKGALMILAPVPETKDYILEVDARWLGLSSSYGLIFGIHKNPDQYYIFDMRTDTKEYRLLHQGPTGLVKIVSPTYTPAIVLEGDANNHLKVMYLGGQISLYINDQFLGTWKDESISGASSAGLFVDLSEQRSSPAEPSVAFDNFIFTPSGDEKPQPILISFPELAEEQFSEKIQQVSGLAGW